MCTFANSEDPDVMLHFIRVYTVKVKKIARQIFENNTIIFESYNLGSLEMCNGLSHVYCI